LILAVICVKESSKHYTNNYPYKAIGKKKGGILTSELAANEVEGIKVVKRNKQNELN
jgi:hypothetical protein